MSKVYEYYKRIIESDEPLTREEIRGKNQITQQSGKGVGYYIIGESNKIK